MPLAPLLTLVWLLKETAEGRLSLGMAEGLSKDSLDMPSGPLDTAPWLGKLEDTGLNPTQESVPTELPTTSAQKGWEAGTLQPPMGGQTWTPPGWEGRPRGKESGMLSGLLLFCFCFPFPTNFLVSSIPRILGEAQTCHSLCLCT